MHVWNISGAEARDSGLPATPTSLLVYATVDQPIEEVVRLLATRFPGVPTFGCTSSGGVFIPTGFSRGTHALAAESGDALQVATALRASNPARARGDARAAASALAAQLGARPEALLLHATPGFEERILEGVDEAFDGDAPPLYGGSAADDDLSGKWRVFADGKVEAEGFVLTAYRGERPIHGSFVAGYTPGAHKGRVTSASGRRVRTIDGQPAAKVYDEWIGGAIRDSLAKGGNVLAQTTLHPLGRRIDKVGAMPRYLLGHPHEVHPDGSLSLFTEVAIGDELVLMVGSRDALIERTDQVAQRAGRHASGLRGGVLVYCAGCVMAVGDDTDTVAHRFADRIGQAPFVGAATFGEQGCFVGQKRSNRHGNLMADALLFE